MRIALAVLLSCAACDPVGREAPPPSPAPPAERLPSATAFDLSATPDGALLTWYDGDALRLRRFDLQGEQISEGRVHAEGVVEVSAAVHEGRVTIAWAHQTSGGAMLATTSGELDALSFGAVASLGPTVLSDGEPTSRRGVVATAVSPHGEVRAFVRGPDEPCIDPEGGTCASFAMRDLGASEIGPARPGLSVPSPCHVPIVAYAVVSGRFHYAICSWQGARETTVLFTAQPEPSYAQANELLSGCDALDFAVVGEDLWLTGRCGSSLAGVRSRGTYVDARKQDLAAVDVRCAGGTPVLHIADRRELLDGPSGHLAAVLPRDIAATGAKALWTGTTLLVASPRRDASTRTDGLVVERHGCDGEDLVRR